MSSNRQFKQDLELLQRAARRERRRFLAEGRKVVQEGIETGCPCEMVYVREGFYGKYADMDACLSAVPTTVLGERDFNRLAQTEQPQGVIGVFDYGSLVAARPSASLLPVLFDIGDPRNVGNILRTAVWFGFAELMIGESCADPFGGKAIRSSMGAIFHSQLILCDVLEERLRDLKDDWAIAVADLDGVDFRAFRPAGKQALVFSNEARGPSDTILALADSVVTIPGSGQAESLSVASAAAVLLAACFR